MENSKIREKNLHLVKQFGYLTIRERLLLRFVKARQVLGLHWRSMLEEQDPFFRTAKGMRYATSAAQAVSDHTRGHVDRIERVVVAMEIAAGIEVWSVV